MTSAVVVEGLVVHRGGRAVVCGLSFVVPTGSIAGLVGPSGCGKTTVVRSLLGVQRGVRGRVQVLGEPAGAPGLRGRVGYVTQVPAVYDDLSVQQDLRYFAAVLGVGPEAVERVLAQVSLTGLADRRVGDLSGGERARVSLGTALLGHPELLVLDEPTTGLDPVLRADLWALFARLAAGGTTLFLSSHAMDEAARCDRLLLMREGLLIADDTPDGLLGRTGAGDVEQAFLSLARAS